MHNTFIFLFISIQYHLIKNSINIQCFIFVFFLRICPNSVNLNLSNFLKWKPWTYLTPFVDISKRETFFLTVHFLSLRLPKQWGQARQHWLATPLSKIIPFRWKGKQFFETHHSTCHMIHAKWTHHLWMRSQNTSWCWRELTVCDIFRCNFIENGHFYYILTGFWLNFNGFWMNFY